MRQRDQESPRAGALTAPRQPVAPGKRTRTESLATVAEAAPASAQAAASASAASASAASSSAPSVAPASPSSASPSAAPAVPVVPAPRPEDRYTTPQLADAYFAVHRDKIFAATAARLAAASLPDPHPRLSWIIVGAPRAAAFEAALLHACDGAFNLASKLPALLYPVDPWQLIDQHRELTSGVPGEQLGGEQLGGEPPRGSLEWSPVVGAALALELEAQLRSSLPRMGRRYVAQAEEGGGSVSVAMLVTSHPFDRIVARLLCTPGAVARQLARRGRDRRGPGDDTHAPTAFRHGLRLVTVEWQGARDPALWNWVRAVDPADASKEEVALALFDQHDGENHTELAYGLTGSAPYFQLPPRWARTLAGAREHAPRPRTSEAATTASEAAEQLGALALADSALGDAAAEAEATRAGKRAASGAAPDRAHLAGLLDRSAAQLYLVLDRLGPWHLHDLVGPALRWIARHQESLPTEAPPALQRWAPIYEAQQALLFTATSELQEVLATTSSLEARAAEPAARPARAVLQAYAIAMGESHLVDSAAVQLAAARRLRAELPLRMLELSLRESRGTAREAVVAAAAAGPPSRTVGTAISDSADPRLASQRGMEHSALASREAAVTGVPVDPHAVESLAVAAAESAHRNRLSALDDRLTALQTQVASARAGAVASLANLFHGELRQLPDTLLRVQLGARAIVAAMDARTQRWLEEHAADAAAITGPTAEAASRRFSAALLDERRRNLARAQRELAELAQRERLQTLFQRAIDTLRDAAIYTLIFETALLIGVSVIGAFAGAAVGGLVRGALLADAAVDSVAFYRGAQLARAAGSVANLTADAAVNALGQTALGQGDDGTARTFAVNLLGSAAVIAALRPLHRASAQWTALETKAEQLWILAGGKRVLAHGAVLTAEMITGAAIGYVVEQMVPGARAGKPPGEDETLGWILQGASMGVGRFVAGRLGQLQARLGAFAESTVHLRKRAAAGAKLAAEVERSGDSATALRLLDEHTRLLHDEAELLANRPGSDTAARLGLDPQQLATLRDGNAAALAETHSSSLAALRLPFAGLEPLSADGTLWSGTRAQIEAALAAAGPAARNVQHDPQRRRFTLELAGRQLIFAEVDHGSTRLVRPPDTTSSPPAHERATGQMAAVAAPEHAAERTTGQMAAVDGHQHLAAELARIRNGPPGRIRPETELSNADVVLAMNEQLRNISPEDVHAILDRFPAAERARARYVLVRSSQFGNMESWNSLRQALLECGQAPLYLPGKGSLADNLAYTAGKGSYDHLPNGELTINATSVIKENTVVILDEVVLRQLQTNPQLVQDIVEKKSIILEPLGFNTGINLYNSPSPKAVAERTASLLHLATEIETAQQVPFDQAVQLALDSNATALAKLHPELPARLRRVSPPKAGDDSDAEISKLLNGEAGINERELEAELKRVPPAMRDQARELLARQSEIFSSRRFAGELEEQHHQLLAQASAAGVPAEKVFFYIPRQGKSYGMLAMAHRQATGTSVDRYINGISETKERSLGKDTAVVIFDDVAGSGESLALASAALVQSGYRGRVIVSPMISTEYAKHAMAGVSAKSPNVEFAPRSMARGLKESFFYQGLDPAQQHELLKSVGSRGYKGNGLSTVFPYMAPDNNNSLFGDLIAKFYIANRNRAAAKTDDYEPLNSGVGKHD